MSRAVISVKYRPASNEMVRLKMFCCVRGGLGRGQDGVCSIEGRREAVREGSDREIEKEMNTYE